MKLLVTWHLSAISKIRLGLIQMLKGAQSMNRLTFLTPPVVESLHYDI